jgi:hypothetical protein
VNPVHRSAVILVTILMAACGGQGGTPQASPSSPASESPSPVTSPSTSPTPAAAAYIVVASPSTGATYTINLLDAQGNLAGAASAKGWNGALTCAGVASALLPPPMSISNSRVYYMDALGVVRFLAPHTGDAVGMATRVPVGAARRSFFSVSPDDKRIAVVVSDFGANKATIRLYVEDLNGAGHHVQIFSSSGPTSLWPIGWHAGNLVLAKVPACIQGGAFGCCGPQELHVVNPANGVRLFTIGGPSCIVSGPSTPVGTPCLTSTNVARVLDWAGVTLQTVQLPFQRFTYLSPDGQHLAYQTDGGTVISGQSAPLQMGVCRWIDNTHIFEAGDSSHMAHIGDITSGSVIPVMSGVPCVGRLPGGL